MHYGHWVFNHYDSSFDHRSTYFYFGIFPYMETARIHILPYVTVTYINRPIHIHGNGYYLSKGSDTPLGNALSDIRKAWLDGRADLVKNHVDSHQQIAVLLDGKYDYSVDGTDYTDMTTDAISQLHTISFTWLEVRERTDGDYTAFGKHVFQDDSSHNKTVYVSYTLKRIGHDFMIVEVGSSEKDVR